MDQDIILKVKRGEAVLLDVRREDEWAVGHAVGAVHFDVARIMHGEDPDAPKDKPVYLYCRSGGRAGTAELLLKARGFSQAMNIGGLRDWGAMGGGVVHRESSSARE